MLWEDGIESWAAFGVTGQPAAILASPEGEIIDGWVGAFDLNDVLAALDSA